MTEYENHVSACAETLTAAMKRSVCRHYVVAVPTKVNWTAGECRVVSPGYLAVISDAEFVPPSGRIVRPCDNGASAHTTWESVPYSAVYGTLMRAACREPILSQF